MFGIPRKEKVECLTLHGILSTLSSVVIVKLRIVPKMPCRMHNIFCLMCVQLQTFPVLNNLTISDFLSIKRIGGGRREPHFQL